jgi:hypothetical protein
MDAGFEEAWPPGPFWPQAVTSGVALGGVNLELFEPATGSERARIETLVLAPSSLEEGAVFLQGFQFEERRKLEPDPSLLALRGFPPSMTNEPQEICVNQIPLDPPYPFFLCSYMPFLLERLNPSRFTAPHGAVVRLELSSPRALDLFQGALGEVELVVREANDSEVLGIWFADGFGLTAPDL